MVGEIDIDAQQDDSLQFEKESEDEEPRSLDLADVGDWAWVSREARRLMER